MATAATPGTATMVTTTGTTTAVSTSTAAIAAAGDRTAAGGASLRIDSGPVASAGAFKGGFASPVRPADAFALTLLKSPACRFPSRSGSRAYPGLVVAAKFSAVVD